MNDQARAELNAAVEQMWTAVVDVAPTRALADSLREIERLPLDETEGIDQIEQSTHNSLLEVFDENVQIIRDALRLRTYTSRLQDKTAGELTGHGWSRIMGMIRQVTIRAKALKISAEARN